MPYLWRTRWLAAGLLLAAPSMLLAADDDSQANSSDRRAELFKQLDSNGDGQISDDEVGEEQQRMFKRLLRTSDKDGNGKLSRDEFLAGTKEDAPREAPAQGGGNDGGGRLSPDALFDRLDANSDGKITPDEVPEDKRDGFRQMVERFDAGKKGGLSKEEFAKALGAMRGGQEGTPPTRPSSPDSQAKPGGSGAPDAEEIFKRGDANNDGKLTREEVPEERREGFDRMLQHFDKDNDQALSLAEFSAGLAMMRGGQQGGQPGGRPGEPGRGPGGPGGPNGPPPPDLLFRTIDADGDGSLSTEELASAGERLKKLDRDGNGSLSRDELRGPGPGREYAQGDRPREGDRPRDGGGKPPMDPEQIMKDSDKDGDGKLSKEETPVALVERFERIDLDGDGYIQAIELKQVVVLMEGGSRPGQPGRPGQGRPGAGGGFDAQAMLKRADTNGDGKLSKDETPERMRENFGRLDTNSDGFLDAAELGKMGGMAGGPGRPGQPGQGGGEMFKQMDKNGDGKLGKDEVGERMRDRFSDIDTNGDGFLDQSELQRVFGQMRQGQGQGQNPRGPNKDKAKEKTDN